MWMMTFQSVCMRPCPISIYSIFVVIFFFPSYFIVASQPTFLHRNLSYMTGRMSRNNSKRKISQVDDVCGMLQAAKKHALDIIETPVSLRMEFFSFFDKNQPMHTLTQVDFIAVNGRGVSKHINVVSGTNTFMCK